MRLITLNTLVFKVYGNLKAKQEQELKSSLDDIDDYYFNKIENLTEKIKHLESNNNSLSKKVLALEQFNSKLEKLKSG